MNTQTICNNLIGLFNESCIMLIRSKELQYGS